MDHARHGEVERVELSRIKQISGPNLARNWVYIPHVTHHDEADITDLDQLAQWGAESGLDPEAVKAAAVSENYKQRLDANTSDAIARGVFGVPTVDTGTRLYFGNDRLDLLDRHLSRG